ncbi:esterase [Roseateles chitosanitabidus]|uniref:esterase n=1 Tax=Roseateles chitosanitabidus TaxID=65048 RepID=UPI00083422C4|nr:esterase [Roseateles chitosanitabidus]MBO9686659.1 esterase [Roseateles chitosanitabidus]
MIQAHVLLPKDGQPDLLFVLLHGAGADGLQMRPLAEALHRQYPRAALVLPDAPDAFDAIPGGGAGFQWYSEQGDDAARAAGLTQALPAVVELIRYWAERLELSWERVALGGFSQGAILALEALQQEEQLAGRVLAFGGAYAYWPQHAPKDVSIHLLHGKNDEELPYVPLLNAARELMGLGADITADVMPDIGHELHPALIERAMEQLRTFIPARLWREAVVAAAEQEKAPKH